jgi:hypothetical protein
MSTSPPVYPLQLEGEKASQLSRWLWLVKWLLLIPHAITLVVLWIGVVVSTVITFFAILITGRYPRGLFRLQPRRVALELARRLLPSDGSASTL